MRHRAAGPRTALAAIAVGALAIVAAILCVLALTVGPLGASDDDAAPAPSPTAAASPSPEPEPSEEPEAAPDEDAAPEPEADDEAQAPEAQPETATRLVAVAGDGVAYRSELAGCGDTAIVERTSDGGATWVAVSTPTAPIGGTGIASLSANADGYVLAGVYDAACAPTAVHSYVAGVEWSDAATVPAPVGLPDGALTGPTPEAPCEDVAVAADRFGGAVLLCGDGTAAVLDGGAWATAAVDGVLTVASGGEDSAFAIVRTDDCDGVAVATLTAEGDALAVGEPGACSPGSDEGVVAGAAGDELWLWDGDAVPRSADGGRSWL